MAKTKNCDFLIVGGGLFGVYLAITLSEKFSKSRIILVEADRTLMSRASDANQARIHQGMHYPRSLETALQSKAYMNRFAKEFDFAIHKEFDQIYGIAKEDSLVDVNSFEEFCQLGKIEYQPYDLLPFLNSEKIGQLYKTREYSLDNEILAKFLLNKLESIKNIEFYTTERVRDISFLNPGFELKTSQLTIKSAKVFNTTYSSTNQILNMLGDKTTEVCYELAEVALVSAPASLKNIGITIMDGPFFSIMPFGKSGLHSLSTVSSTPHFKTRGKFPKFACQENNDFCSETKLGNCQFCDWKPQTAWARMSDDISPYLLNSSNILYKSSKFGVKIKLVDAAETDSRKTYWYESENFPSFYSIFSGKISHIYEMQNLIESL